RTCRGCASALPPVTDNSSRASWSCATSPRRKCRCRRSAWLSPPMATRRMWKKIGDSTRKNSISPTRSSATVTVTGGRPADSFCGSTSRRRAATKPWRHGLGAKRGRAWGPAAIWRATKATAPIPGSATFASPWCRTRTQRHRRSTASSRCWAEGHHGGHRPRPRQSELPLRRRARSVAAAPARAWRACFDRARDAPCARAPHLVRAGPLPQPCPRCAPAQHSPTAPVRNILGVPGAIVADLLTQLFGVAALAFILPIAIWGWRLVTHRPMQRERVRLLFWVLGVLLTAGCAAALPRSAAWPLPVGLGGVIGDWMLRLPALVAGGTLAEPVRVAIALAAGVGMLLCFAVATGFGWRADDGDAEGPLEEDDARGSISLGFITHGFLSLKARLARALTRRPSARAPTQREAPPPGRIEPRFAGSAPATLQPAIAPEADGERDARPQAARKPPATRPARHEGRAAAMCYLRSNSSPRRKRSGAPC